MSSRRYSDREELVGYVRLAAELEHALTATYLFASHSMKRHGDDIAGDDVEMVRMWRRSLLRIARQEMEHLAITANLLAALGEPAHLSLPTFPLPQRSYPLSHDIELKPFTLDSLVQFIMYEVPNECGAKEEELREFLNGSTLPQDEELLRRLNEDDRTESISQLYAKIESILGQSNAADMFVGRYDMQIDNTLVYEKFPPVDPARRVYDVLIAKITDQDSALAAVRQIRSEGEGGQRKIEGGRSHFEALVDVYIEFSKRTRLDPAAPFAASRPVVPNPYVEPQWSLELEVYKRRKKGSEVTNDIAIKAMAIFDDSYKLLLRMLIRFFATAGSRDRRLRDIQSVVFFPMMTLVMRPLGDMITSLPAGNDAEASRAGPAFDAGRGVSFVPGGDLALLAYIEELEALKEKTEELAADIKLTDDDLRRRLVFMSQNFWRMADNLKTFMREDAE